MDGAEIELQYLYRGEDLPVAPERLGDLVLACSREVVVLDAYYDTADLDLRHVGCRLRVRRVAEGDDPLLTWKGPSRRRKGGAKERQEVEIPLEKLPADGDDLERQLRRYGLWALVRRSIGGGRPDLREIGLLRTERSVHVYVNGLRRVELVWDLVEYPTGPPQLRLEVEAKSRSAMSRLSPVSDRLRKALGADLVRPSRGKARELYARLYP
jgi:hypothetical protein